MVTNKLTPPISTKFYNFNKFVNNLDLDLFLTNPDSLPCKCNNVPFADRHYKHIVIGDLRIIRNNVLRKLFIKGSKYREVRPSNLEKAKCCILGLDNCIKMVLINLSFWNGPIMLRSKLMKEESFDK